MKRINEFEQIIQEHVEAFGVEPVITGAEFSSSGDIDLKILRAIEIGIPYVEEELPKNVAT